MTLAWQWFRQYRFVQRAQLMIDRLHRHYDITMMAVHRSGLDHMVVVALAQSDANFQLSARIGSLFPALISATGRCVAAFAERPIRDIERRFAGLRWDDPPSFAEWQAEVALTRGHGYAVDADRYIAGVTVVAAPAWDGAGAPRHALTAIGFSSALRERGVEHIGSALTDGARALPVRPGAEARA